MTEAELVLRLCDRFHCRPSQALREDASVLRMLEIEKLEGGEQG